MCDCAASRPATSQHHGANRQLHPGCRCAAPPGEPPRSSSCKCQLCTEGWGPAACSCGRRAAARHPPHPPCPAAGAARLVLQRQPPPAPARAAALSTCPAVLSSLLTCTHPVPSGHPSAPPPSRAAGARRTHSAPALRHAADGRAPTRYAAWAPRSASQHLPASNNNFTPCSSRAGWQPPCGSA